MGAVIEYHTDGRYAGLYTVRRGDIILGAFADHANAREYALGTLTGRVLTTA